MARPPINPSRKNPHPVNQKWLFTRCGSPILFTPPPPPPDGRKENCWRLRHAKKEIRKTFRRVHSSYNEMNEEHATPSKLSHVLAAEASRERFVDKHTLFRIKEVSRAPCAARRICRLLRPLSCTSRDQIKRPGCVRNRCDKPIHRQRAPRAAGARNIPPPYAPKCLAGGGGWLMWPLLFRSSRNSRDFDSSVSAEPRRNAVLDRHGRRPYKWIFFMHAREAGGLNGSIRQASGGGGYTWLGPVHHISVLSSPRQIRIVDGVGVMALGSIEVPILSLPYRRCSEDVPHLTAARGN